MSTVPLDWAPANPFIYFFLLPLFVFLGENQVKESFYFFSISCLFAIAKQCLLGCRAEKTLSPRLLIVLDQLTFCSWTLHSTVATDSLGCTENIWLNLKPQQPDKKNEDLFPPPSAWLPFLKMQKQTPPPPKKARWPSFHLARAQSHLWMTPLFARVLNLAWQGHLHVRNQQQHQQQQQPKNLWPPFSRLHVKWGHLSPAKKSRYPN